MGCNCIRPWNCWFLSYISSSECKRNKYIRNRLRKTWKRPWRTSKWVSCCKEYTKNNKIVYDSSTLWYIRRILKTSLMARNKNIFRFSYLWSRYAIKYSKKCFKSRRYKIEWIFNGMWKGVRIIIWRRIQNYVNIRIKFWNLG